MTFKIGRVLYLYTQQDKYNVRNSGYISSFITPFRSERSILFFIAITQYNTDVA